MSNARLGRVVNPIPVFKTVLPYSMGMFYSGVLKYFAIGIDSFLLGIFLNPFAVSTYNIVTKFFFLINLLTGKLLTSVNTAVMHINASKDHARLEHLMQKTIQIRMVIVFTLVFPTILFMPPLLLLWVGEKFVPYAIWGQIYLIVPLFSCLGEASGVLTGCGKLKFVNTISSVSSIFNFVVSLILVKWIGFGGVIIGTVVSNIFLGDPVIFTYICRKLQFASRPVLIHFWRSLICNALVFAAMLFCVRKIGGCEWITLFLCGGLCTAVFLGLNLFVSLKKELRTQLMKTAGSMLHLYL